MTSKEKTRIRKKWRRWLQAIGRDIGWLLTSHDVFLAIQEAFKKNKDIRQPTLVYRWITSNYAAQVSTGVRRLVDKDTRTVSLYRLLQDISEHPDVITRRYFVERHIRGSPKEEQADEAELGHHDCDRFTRKGSDEVNKSKLSADQRRLRRDTRRIGTFVDKWIAHRDADQRRFSVPTYADVGEALRDIDQICCEYALLLTGSDMTTWKPVLQYDWREPLRHPWIVR